MSSPTKWIRVHLNNHEAVIKRDGLYILVQFKENVSIPQVFPELALFVGAAREDWGTETLTFNFVPTENYNGSFMMCYSLNSVLSPESSNYGVVDASSAYLNFNFGSDYLEHGSYYAGKKDNMFSVDTYMFHLKNVLVRDGSVSVSL